MTASEMVTNFKFRLDKVDSLNYPNFENVEIDLLLNQATERIIKQRYGATNTKRTSFEETQKRTEDLKNIVVTAPALLPFQTANNINSDSAFITLPADHYFTIFENCIITYPDCKSVNKQDTVPVVAIQHNDYNKNIDNPFSKPNKNKVLRLMEDGQVELIPATGISIVSYKLRYIRKPATIDSVTIPNVDSDLSEHLHDEIVDEAVTLALEDIESRRQQSYNVVDNTNE